MLTSLIIISLLQLSIPSIARAIRASWQARWDISRATGNKLTQLKPTVERWSSSIHRIRHWEVVLAHLRIDHTRLTHGYLLACSNPPRCPSCHIPFSVVHILVGCPSPFSLLAFSVFLSSSLNCFELRRSIHFPGAVCSPAWPIIKSRALRRYETAWTASRLIPPSKSKFNIKRKTYP